MHSQTCTLTASVAPMDEGSRTRAGGLALPSVDASATPNSLACRERLAVGERSSPSIRR